MREYLVLSRWKCWGGIRRRGLAGGGVSLQVRFKLSETPGLAFFACFLMLAPQLFLPPRLCSAIMDSKTLKLKTKINSFLSYFGKRNVTVIQLQLKYITDN